MVRQHADTIYYPSILKSSNYDMVAAEINFSGGVNSPSVRAPLYANISIMKLGKIYKLERSWDGNSLERHVYLVSNLKQFSPSQ